MNSDEISLKLDQIDQEILEMRSRLDIVQKAKYEKERELFELSETIRMVKFSLSKKRLEKEMMQRLYWRTKV